MSPKLEFRLIAAACASAFVGLALMIWSVLDPRPIPVVVAMTVGQGFGTLSFLIYLFIVFMDLRRSQRR